MHSQSKVELMGRAFCDSQSALYALSSARTSCGRVVRDILCQLAIAHDASLVGFFVWTPSHIGLAGNDTVDRLAKAACALGLDDANAVPSLRCLRNSIYSAAHAMTVHRRDTDRATSVFIQHHDNFLRCKHKYRRHGLMIIAPWKDPAFFKKFPGRPELFQYAKAHDIPLPVTPKSPWSMDANLVHISYESGMLEDPANAPPLGIFQLTTNPEEAPNTPQRLTLTFRSGLPEGVTVDGEQTITDPLQLFLTCNRVGAAHGLGRIDIVENRFIGLKMAHHSPVAHVHVDQKEWTDWKELNTLENLVKYCLQVYLQLYYDIKVHHRLEDGPKHILTQLRVMRSQPKKVQTAVTFYVRTGAWFAHSECVLLSLMASQSEDDRRVCRDPDFEAEGWRGVWGTPVSRRSWSSRTSYRSSLSHSEHRKSREAGEKRLRQQWWGSRPEDGFIRARAHPREGHALLQSRGVYETPGLTLLQTAHQDLEVLCLDREVRKIKTDLSTRMAEQVYNGFWFSPEFEYTRQCVEASQRMVTGSVFLKVYKGNVYVEGRSSHMSLYNQELVSMDVQGDFDPTDARGFIRLNALRLREYQRVKEAKGVYQ
ncbi:Argininosuccinate synthase [Chionoecetes opilio]|uniref:argininosuccinate synthase n=1 Tax=Chionoecetes opilio TaxID=41210 RepID=A0A8J4YSF4_CHIOP|nr:Argininosuccinate synthase [Chionoecetes opilio]